MSDIDYALLVILHSGHAADYLHFSCVEALKCRVALPRHKRSLILWKQGRRRRTTESYTSCQMTRSVRTRSQPIHDILIRRVLEAGTAGDTVPYHWLEDHILKAIANRSFR